MQTDDRREEWMGLGIILTEIRFRTWVENRDDSKLGVRVRTTMGWRSLFTSGSLAQQSCVERFLLPFDIELKEKYTNQEDLFKWMVVLDKLESLYGISYAVSDRKGLHMIKWVFDNPVPSTWEQFIEWVEAYDSETDMIETL
jgi:hypothetical protein